MGQASSQSTDKVVASEPPTVIQTEGQAKAEPKPEKEEPKAEK